MIPGAPVNDMDLYIDPNVCVRCFSPVWRREIDDSAFVVICRNRQCGYEAKERAGSSSNAAMGGRRLTALRPREEWQKRTRGNGHG